MQLGMEPKLPPPPPRKLSAEKSAGLSPRWDFQTNGVMGGQILLLKVLTKKDKTFEGVRSSGGAKT